MKIRSGFVSNSSTSSFCIYGAEPPDEWIEKLDEEDTKEHAGELVRDFNKENGTHLLVEGGPSYLGYTFYIGREWCCIEDDETGGQFKMSIEQALEKLFGRKVKCSTVEEAWREG